MDLYTRDMHNGAHKYRLKSFPKSCDGEISTGTSIVNSIGQEICNNNDYYPLEVSVEDMRRIVACLNHCHGIPTETLEIQNKLLGLTP